MASFTILRPQEEESDSSEEENVDDFVSYKERAEWSDLEPTTQDDGVHNVANIQYTPMFAETFGYFRTVMKNKEMSTRALALTADCIRFNPSNYTVWHYRRLLIDHLNVPLSDELRYIENVINNHQKNYQVWEHYKCMLKSFKAKIRYDPEECKLDELVLSVKRFVHKILDDDSKNYHAWQHRQWMIDEWSQWDGELGFSNKLIQLDIRNNSAWNHRFFVIEHTTELDDDTVRSETAYALSKIDITPHNESAWNYLLGLYRKSGLDYDVSSNLFEHCRALYEDKKCRSSYLMSFLIVYYCHKMSLIKEAKQEHDADSKYLQYYTETIDLCTDLETSVDTLRSQYWKYRANIVREKYAQNIAR